MTSSTTADGTAHFVGYAMPVHTKVRRASRHSGRPQTLRSRRVPLSDFWILFEWLLTYPAVVQTANHGADVVWPVAFTKSPLVRADTVRPARDGF